MMGSISGRILESVFLTHPASPTHHVLRIQNRQQVRRIFGILCEKYVVFSSQFDVRLFRPPLAMAEEDGELVKEAENEAESETDKKVINCQKIYRRKKMTIPRKILDLQVRSILVLPSSTTKLHGTTQDQLKSFTTFVEAKLKEYQDVRNCVIWGEIFPFNACSKKRRRRWRRCFRQD